jgi:hypothetical protein
VSTTEPTACKPPAVAVIASGSVVTNDISFSSSANGYLVVLGC